MDRFAWLKEKQRLTEEQETLEAHSYDEHWGAIEPTHRQYFDRFLALCPPQGHLLDAACGTGKYWPLIQESGRTVFGVDQSQGALDRAKEKFPEIPGTKITLQEIDYSEAFAGAVCMDALELSPPEDWPVILSNLYRAIQPGGSLYFTVELTEEPELAIAFAQGQALSLPVVYGEANWVPEDGYDWSLPGYYHYYPRLEQVRDWITATGFRLIDDAAGDGYHHFLVQKR
jgi:SAM-dependent methyltransferase